MSTLTGPKIAEAVDPRSSPTPRDQTFLFLWGVFVLFHQALSYHHGITTARGFVASLAVFLAALLLVLKPSSLARFAGLLLAMIAVVWFHLPTIPNHIFFTFLVSVTALAALAAGFLKGGRSAGPDSLRQAVALIRCEVLIMYFFVTLHKLNFDYFNADVSCAASMYREIATYLRFMPTGASVETLMVVVVLILEGLLPILLAIPRTRVLGVGVGLLFHDLLSLHPNRYVYSYSAMMFALLATFLPDDFLAACRTTARRISLRTVAGFSLLGILAAAVLLTTGLAVNLHKLDDPLAIWIRLLWMVFGFAVMAIYAATLLRRSRAEWTRLLHGPESPEPSYFRPARSWLLIFPALVFFNGCCPYLGLKTETAFAMFSNLRTEGARTNHFFMPIRFRLADYQEDLVQIVDSSDGVLQSMPSQGLFVTYFDLRRIASGAKDPNFTVTYIRNNQQITVSRRATPTAEVFKSNPWPLNKLFYFRPVQIGYEPQICRH